MKLFPAFGGAPYSPHSQKVIRLILKGCVNRPFFHISVMEARTEPEDPVIEQIGTYDPLPNSHNEKLVALNFCRLEYWLKNDVIVSKPVLKILGLSGYFPIHPDTFIEAWENRKKINKTLEELKIAAANLSQNKTSQTDSTTPEVLSTSSDEKSVPPD